MLAGDSGQPCFVKVCANFVAPNYGQEGSGAKLHSDSVYVCGGGVCVCLEANTLFSRSSSLYSDWNCLVAVFESSKEASLALGLCEI